MLLVEDELGLLAKDHPCLRELDAAAKKRTIRDTGYVDLNDRGAQSTVADRYTAQLGHISKLADSLSADSAPTLIGEFGIPFDLNFNTSLSIPTSKNSLP